MSETNGARGLIAVDKMGGKVLFLNPETYATEVVLDGFPRTVHELLVIPETGLAYVPIFGDGIHGRNPNPGHLLCIIDLVNRKHVGDIDLRPYIARIPCASAPTASADVISRSSVRSRLPARMQTAEILKVAQALKHLKRNVIRFRCH